MRMNRRHTVHPASFRAGRALRIWIYVLFAAGATLTALLLSVRLAPAQRAYRKGRDLLNQGENSRAAAQFNLALKLDPGLEAGWHGLLEAEPSSAVCRRFAQHLPQLFDRDQPVQDNALLVRGTGWNEVRWRHSLMLYEKTVLAAPPDEDDTAATLRLDYVGRKQIATAWSEVRKIKAELQSGIENPLPPAKLRPFVVYDLPAAEKVLAASGTRFENPGRWLELLARMDAAIKRANDGFAKLAKVSQSQPCFVPTQLTLAYTECARGKPTMAETRCRKLLQSAPPQGKMPGEVRIRYCLARAVELAGRPSAAAAEIHRILALDPHNLQAMLRLAALYLQAGRTKEAGAIVDELAQPGTMDAKTSYIKGMVSLLNGEYQAADAQLTTALQYYEHQPEVRYYLARAKQRVGHYLLASNEFAKVADQTPHSGWPLAAAAASALAAGDTEDAGGAADAVLNQQDWLKAAPRLRDYALRFKLAAAALEGAHEMANIAAKKLLHHTASRELANYLTAGVWAGQAYTQADADVVIDKNHLAFFEAAAKEEPSARYCLAFLLAAAGRVEEAQNGLEKLNQAQPQYLLAALHLARFYLIRGKTERAARVLERTGQIDKSPDAARAMALIDWLQGIKASPTTHDIAETVGKNEVLGPHLGFFAMTTCADGRAFAQRIVLLDPVGELGHNILRLTYAQVREQGLEGVAAAAGADRQVDLAIRTGIAEYQADSSKLYRLAIGRFWDDLPFHP